MTIHSNRECWKTYSERKDISKAGYGIKLGGNPIPYSKHEFDDVIRRFVSS